MNLDNLKPQYNRKGPPPYGLIWNGTPDGNKLQVALLIRAWRREKKYSECAIRDALNDRAHNGENAIPAPRGGKWGTSSVRMILKNKKYEAYEKTGK